MKIGKVSESVLKRSVLRQIKTKRTEILNGAGVGADCAIFAPAPGELWTSCMQEGRIASEESAGLLGEPAVTVSHLIRKCANNLAASGSEPVAVMLTLLLPESVEEPWLKALMKEAENACEKLSVQIAGGQTRVSAAVTAPVAVVTGYGKRAWGTAAGQSAGKVCGTAAGQFAGEACGITAAGTRLPAPGQDIVVSKWIGLEGTALLAKKYREKLLGRYPAYFVEEAVSFEQYYSVLPEAATAVKSGVCAMHDASEGGIFAALWELAERAGVGLTIDLRKLPIRQETVEVCECCGVNPYELASGGCLVMTGTDGQALAEALRREGIPAAVVGKITDSNDRIILNEDEIRYMDRPRTDEIYKSI